MFADILFKPSEYKANDMAMWKIFSEMLSLMIKNYQMLFDGIKISKAKELDQELFEEEKI
jgi:hypothetical protein